MKLDNRCGAKATVGTAGSGSAVYGLRHAVATMMLRGNVPPADVARRLGHSVDMLMKVYAGVSPTNESARTS